MCFCVALLSLTPLAICELSNDIYDYHYVSQGKISVASIDDGEDMEFCDVRIYWYNLHVYKTRTLYHPHPVALLSIPMNLFPCLNDVELIPPPAIEFPSNIDLFPSLTPYNFNQLLKCSSLRVCTIIIAFP